MNVLTGLITSILCAILIVACGSSGQSPEDNIAFDAPLFTLDADCGAIGEDENAFRDIIPTWKPAS